MSTKPKNEQVAVASYEKDGYRRDGAHVLVGTGRPLADEFVPSGQTSSPPIVKADVASASQPNNGSPDHDHDTGLGRIAMSHCLNAGRGCVMWAFGGSKSCGCGCDICMEPFMRKHDCTGRYADAIMAPGGAECTDHFGCGRRGCPLTLFIEMAAEILGE